MGDTGLPQLLDQYEDLIGVDALRERDEYAGSHHRLLQDRPLVGGEVRLPSAVLRFAVAFLSMKRPCRVCRPLKCKNSNRSSINAHDQASV
jgi:hypothetical protein